MCIIPSPARSSSRSSACLASSSLTIKSGSTSIAMHNPCISSITAAALACLISIGGLSSSPLICVYLPLSMSASLSHSNSLRMGYSRSSAFFCSSSSPVAFASVPFIFITKVRAIIILLSCFFPVISASPMLNISSHFHFSLVCVSLPSFLFSLIVILLLFCFFSPVFFMCFLLFPLSFGFLALCLCGLCVCSHPYLCLLLFHSLCFSLPIMFSPVFLPSSIISRLSSSSVSSLFISSFSSFLFSPSSISFCVSCVLSFVVLGVSLDSSLLSPS